MKPYKKFKIGKNFTYWIVPKGKVKKHLKPQLERLNMWHPNEYSVIVDAVHPTKPNYRLNQQGFNLGPSTIKLAHDSAKDIYNNFMRGKL